MSIELKEAEIIAKGMVKAAEKSGEKIAQGIIESSEKNAQTLMKGFKEIGKSLSGTKAELMMKCLFKKANNGEIPEPGSKEWLYCKRITDKVLEEYQK